jgi:HAD superfamily hydrolase (TIGR01509 family)
VINDLQVDAGTTLFIDDSINNIHGAEKAGLRTLLLTPEMRIETADL